MKLSLFFLYLSIAVIGQTNADVELIEIQDGFWQVVSYEKIHKQMVAANAMVVETKNHLIMIDTPWTQEATTNLLSRLKQKFKKPVKIAVLTHHHSDSSGGLLSLKKEGVLSISHYKTWRQLFNYPERLSTDSMFYKNNHEVVIDDKIMKIYYPGEGHSKDNIVVYFQKEKILYGGCFIKSKETQSLGNLKEANTQRWPYSLRKTQVNFGLMFKKIMIVPGHGKADYNLIQHTLRLLKEFRKKNKNKT